MAAIPTFADVVVVGGGVIGLSSAWRLAQSRLRVTLCDPLPARGSSWVAAGMLAPITELHYGEEPLLALTLASARSWPAFAHDLEVTTGSDIGWQPAGTLLVPFDIDDRRWAQNLHRFQQDLDMAVTWLTTRQARELEPGLAPGISGAIWAPDDHQVDNRRLLPALVDAARAAGVEFVEAPVRQINCTAGSVTGVSLDSGDVVNAPSAVLCAGWQSRAVAGLPDSLVPPVRPVKGQILRLAHRRGMAPVLARTVRAVVHGSSVYLVPRATGEVVVGATSEEMGDDQTPTAGAVYELLRDAITVVPGLRELAVDEFSAGLRPGSPDNAPIIGAAPAGAGADGLVLATGHYRNGILLAPLTADAVVAAVTGAEPSEVVRPFGPGRFAAAGVRTASGPSAPPSAAPSATGPTTTARSGTHR